MKRSLLAPLLLLALTASVQAENRYVNDNLVISLRADKGNGAAIIDNLESGTSLKVLAVEGEFVQVRTPKGREGWVRAQFLSDTPIARERLVAVERRMAELQGQQEGLRQQLAANEKVRSELQQANEGLKGKISAMEAEAAQLRSLAEEPLRLADENRGLQEKLASLSKEVEQLRTENSALTDATRREWFLVGGGVAGGGLLLGLILPRMWSRRRDSLFR